jgi:hypothetical protein
MASGGLAFDEEKDMEKLAGFARKGWVFERFSFMGYKLKKSTPVELQYALDYRKDADEDYFCYFEEAGWKHEGTSGNYIHLFSAPKGIAPIYTDQASILEKYQIEKKWMGKAALWMLVLNIAIAAVFYSLTTASFYQANDTAIKVTFAVLQVLGLICLIFTGLPFLGYMYRVKKWRKEKI